MGPTIVGLISQYLGVAEEEFKEGNPSFFEALENQEISGLDTYNIKKNPRYRDAFSSEIVEVDDDGCPYFWKTDAAHAVPCFALGDSG